jgi:hypothetical protein
MRSNGARTLSRLAVTVVFILGAAGCVRRDGRNSDCRWPPENAPHAATARHLSGDAEFAEDLAIRYADIHHGLRTPYYVSGEDYSAARDQCMETLFDQIAKEHGVSVAQVSSSLGRNRAFIDLAESLPFVRLYVSVVAVVVRLNWRRYSPNEQGWIPGITMALFLSLAFAAGHNARRGMVLVYGRLPDRQQSYELPRWTIVLGSVPAGVVRKRSDGFLAGCN